MTIDLFHLLEKEPTFFTEVYWKGSYPHNKIASGLNRILKKLGFDLKIIFDRKEVLQRVESVNRKIPFDDEVQIELAMAATQLSLADLELIAIHKTDSINGNLNLYIQRIGAHPAIDSQKGCAVSLTSCLSNVRMKAIRIDGFAYEMIRNQEDSFSALYDLSYEEVRERLIDDLLDPYDFARTITPTSSGSAMHIGSWFEIIESSEGAVYVRVSSLQKRRVSHVWLSAKDFEVLQDYIPSAIGRIAYPPFIKLVSLRINTEEEKSEKFVLPLAQVRELNLAICKFQKGALPTPS
jgi:hypothetical protein